MLSLPSPLSSSNDPGNDTEEDNERFLRRCAVVLLRMPFVCVAVPSCRRAAEVDRIDLDVVDGEL
jgi:hypothetical protein|tara:strand:- start:388 stop:582 length:195 start_codon:yes stop_codon:yes gene_type:complete